jgi:hypothetical protein
VPATEHFTFDLAGALSDQLYEVVRNNVLTQVPLIPSELDKVDKVPGIYQLYLHGNLVYIGKADHDLRGRLYDHYRKISGRLNITTSDVTFTGLYLERTWIPVGPEAMLTNRYKDDGFEVPWFHSGFGMKDPGTERDTTTYKATHFDIRYPINLDFIVPGLTTGTHPVNEILPVIKENLPYYFRFAQFVRRRARHPDYLASSMTVPAGNLTAAQVFDILVHSLPSGWQVIAFPGYVIMYKNTRSYPSATRTFKI